MDKGSFVIVLIILAVLVTGAALMNASDPVGSALLQAQVGIAAAPATVSPAGGLWEFAARAMILLAGLAVLGGLAWFAYTRLTAHRSAGSWASGPNARWQRYEPQRKLSLTDLLTLQLTRQVLGDQEPRVDALPDERRKAEF